MGATYPGRLLLRYWKNPSEKTIDFGKWYCTDPTFRKSVQHEYRHLVGALQQGNLLQEMHRIKATSVDELIDYQVFLGRILQTVPETPWTEVRTTKKDRLAYELKDAPTNTRAVLPEPHPVTPAELAASIDFGFAGNIELSIIVTKTLKADPDRRGVVEAAANTLEGELGTYARSFVNEAYAHSDHS